MAEPQLLRIHATDNVAVALTPLTAGQAVRAAGAELIPTTDIPAGHKVALEPLTPGESVVKYGFPIGAAMTRVGPGEWLHEHNVRTLLSEKAEYQYEPMQHEPVRRDAATFLGYRRPNGRVGIRNEIWIINTVGCVNHAADRIARVASERLGGRIDVHAFSHPYGCSQLGDDLGNTQRVLAGLLRHPNAGGVLVLGLGCENNQLAELLALAGEVDRDRLRSFNAQEVMDEVEDGVTAVLELAERMEADRRVEVPASEIVLGMKCGGSDGFSGISANPLVGRIADRVTALGGGAILTEVPEMFGAEQMLMQRAVDEEVFGSIVAMIDDFKDYFRQHGQPIYENPSPGNKAGGITTLEEKSLGAVQKGGRATVTAVARYGELAAAHGLTLLEAPGNDGVSSTALIASGATMLLFTTGRGTPLGFPAPTLKISSNTQIAKQKPHWIDFDAGEIVAGTAAPQDVEDRLFERILDVASGREQANNEKHGYREIAVWKGGVTL